MTRYPHSRVVVMALCPSGPLPAPFFGTGPSPSARRMNELAPNWRDRALGVNAWPSKRDYDSRVVSSRVSDILLGTHAEVVVALGREVAHWLGVGHGHFYTWKTIEPWPDWHPIDVLLFPHPSGRNRLWNDPANVRRARAALRDALDSPR